MGTAKKIIITLLCILNITLGMGYFLGIAYFQTHFKIGTTINGLHCSFKSIGDVESLLAKEIENYAIAVHTRNNGIEKIDAKEVGMQFTGHQQLIDVINSQNYKLWFVPETVNHKIDVYSIDSDKMYKTIDSLECMQSMVEPEQSSIVEVDGVYKVSPMIKGTKLNQEKTYQVIETAVRQREADVDLEEKECYIDLEVIDEAKLQESCDFLNSIQDTIITYDFGDKTEKVDFDKIKSELLNDSYSLSQEKTQKYVTWLANAYDTIGKERKFITYDDRSAIVSGGDYGWQIDIKATASELTDYISKNTIDVITPVYKQTAVSRDKNDIGHSYFEMDTENRKAVLYVDGKPVLETKIQIGNEVTPGFYKTVKSNGAVTFGDYQLSVLDAGPAFTGNDDISGVASNSIQENCIVVPSGDMEKINNTIQDGWPVVVYGKDNIR